MCRPSIDGPRRGAKMVLRAFTRSWRGHRQLDLPSAPAAYMTWRQRALGYLSCGCDAFFRGDVRRLLLWAENMPDEINAATAEVGASAVGLIEPVLQVVHALSPGIRRIVADPVTQRSERCQGDSSIQLWRRLYREWRGAAQHITMIQAKQFQ